jgi:ribosomal 50S subunit-recycling heat shock protein
MRRARTGPSPAGPAQPPEHQRLDCFLRNVGLVPRRSLAQQACQRGLIEVDGKVAKPATRVRPGQELTVRLGLRVRRLRVRQVPTRPVPRAARPDYFELLAEEPVDWRTEA